MCGSALSFRLPENFSFSEIISTETSGITCTAEYVAISLNSIVRQIPWQLRTTNRNGQETPFICVPTGRTIRLVEYSNYALLKETATAISAARLISMSAIPVLEEK